METNNECFSCDYCHRVGTGITIVNGFKMCPMCLAEYQHKSGENNKLREELGKKYKEIERLKTELAELKQNAIVRPSKYKAKLGTVYWTISDYGEIFDIQADSPSITNFRWKMGNMFATEKEAEEALKKLEE